MSTLTSQRHQRNRNERRMFAMLMTTFAMVVAAVFAAIYGPTYLAYRSYVPKEGDMLFQSLPHSPLVDAIEGATGSPYSHCGIVGIEGGDWVVYEAYRGVEITSLREFVFRGRNHGFVVYRLKPKYQKFVPATVDAARAYLGRPYDARYRMDDEQIYCSELIYKAYRDASNGEQLGAMVRFGDLRWQPHESTIRRIERGPVPVDREMITPKELARASQLTLVTAYRIAFEK